MKLKTLVSGMVVAGLLSASLATLPVLAKKEAKEATAYTKANNDALYGQLPFFDKTDFRNAHKGFVAALPQAVIKGEKAPLSGIHGNTLLSKKEKKLRVPSIRASGVRPS